jgi:hypothetical protein
MSQVRDVETPDLAPDKRVNILSLFAQDSFAASLRDNKACIL